MNNHLIFYLFSQLNKKTRNGSRQNEIPTKILISIVQIGTMTNNASCRQSIGLELAITTRKVGKHFPSTLKGLIHIDILI